VNGVVACDRYEDRSTAAPQQLGEFSSDAAFTVTVSLVMEIESGQVEEYEVDHDLMIQLGPDWPKPNHG
jgi:hypothetical protein